MSGLSDLRDRVLNLLATATASAQQRGSRDSLCLLNVCAVRRRRVPVGASPTRQTLQPEATGAVMEVTK